MTPTPLTHSGIVVEIHTGRLKPGTDPEGFRRAAAAFMPLLRATPGFVGRETLYDAERDLWTDVVRWTSREAAAAGAASLERHPAVAEFIGLIDLSTMTATLGAPVVLDDRVPAQR